ncbi:hypothetical protein BJ973_003902 [Actinoplanes tereljensis]|uniref:Type VII secretion-associated serine protease n=1 Tax=Paractinoplanes tereljensis TaxID=571912 RepID=A0A919TXU2_9ACTN|nr:S8 family serine peptidase [Actinoplanes tereljensis]GIF25624.1 type VII secretion-associated serine protease [Actinoplanes tereljensis]
MLALSLLAAAGNEPPSLPTSECAGPSPVTAENASWGQLRMDARSVWTQSNGGGVLVAVLDTGVSAAAPALSGAVHTGDDTDCRGRGTALAGLIAARPVDGSPVVGIAPAAGILPVRIVGDDGKPTAQGLAAGIQTALAGNAKIIMLGTGVTTPDDELRDAVQAAEAADAVVIAPISADKENPVWYPAAYESVLAVNGEAPDGKATVAAPATAGVDLLAPAAGFGIAPVGSGHYQVGGTAVAAAYTAGTAALLRSARPQLSADQVRHRLETTAEHPVRASDAATHGFGAVDPYAAVATTAGEPSPVPMQRERLALPAEPETPAAPRIAALVAAGAVAAAAVAVAALAWIRQSRRRRAGWPPAPKGR